MPWLTARHVLTDGLERVKKTSAIDVVKNKLEKCSVDHICEIHPRVIDNISVSCEAVRRIKNTPWLCEQV